MPPALPGTVLERKFKIPSTQKVPQKEEGEVAPTEHPQRGRETGHSQPPGERLEGMKADSRSGIAPGFQPALHAL